MYKRKEAILNEIRLLTNGVKDVLQLPFIELRVKQSCVYKNHKQKCNSMILGPFS